ncbi:hypothetical protein E2C01_055358 [Portunus trituberculatus]|uniref:Uncharacterized protein n=1 Tax=Portunus trituberculatus TaxID=210409 RepID=A0A5B7GUS0_PORTR|nr:hypothetical protein [Portunus trituberculatus]
MSSHMASSPPSPAKSDVLGEGTNHPTDSVMLITSGPQSRADCFVISGTPPPAQRTLPSLLFLPKDFVHMRNAAGFFLMSPMTLILYILHAKLEQCHTRCDRASGSRLRLVTCPTERYRWTCCFLWVPSPLKIWPPRQAKFCPWRVNSYLNNLAKLPASSFSQAECLASSRPASPKPTACSRVREALLAEGAREGSLGHKLSSVYLGKRAAMADALSFTKRSQAKVGGSMRPASLSLPSAQNPDSIKCIQPLSPWEVGCERQHQVTPLLCPRHPKGGLASGNPIICASSPLFGSTATFAPPWGGYWESVSGEKEDDSSGSEDRLLESSPAFAAMMYFIYEKFPEACDLVVQDSTLFLLSMQRSEVPATTPRLRYAHPIDLMMSEASEAFTCANKSSKPSFANPDLVQHLTVLFLPLRTHRTSYFGEAPSVHEPMPYQPTHSIQHAMVDQARITTFALSNTRAVRWESYVSHLPHRFSSASKSQLCCSDVDSDLLFNSASVEKAIG